MGLVETEGLILRTYSLSDADKIVVALTQSDGLVRGVAKGAKRLKSRFGSGLEPFSVVKLAYFRKEERELVTITETELVRSYFVIASEPAFLETFSSASDLLQSFAPPHDPNERLYNMTKVCLEAAAEDIASISLVYAYFEIWLLKLGGFLPQWDNCAECGRSPGTGENTDLAPDYGILCKSCKGRGKLQSISPGQRELFLLAQRTSPQKFAAAASEQSANIETVSAILRRIIARILNREVDAVRKRSNSAK